MRQTSVGPSRQWISALLAAFAAALVTTASSARAQTLPAGSPQPLSGSIQIDDQLFDAEQFQVVGHGAGAQLRFRSAAPIDSSTVDRLLASDGVTFGGWDFGVVPVEFDGAVTPARQAQFLRNCQTWGRVAELKCIERTSQSGFLRVNSAAAAGSQPSPCYSNVGQFRRLAAVVLNLGEGCWGDPTILHEMGHALGFQHEHQRPDRDAYLSVDLSVVTETARFAYSLIGLRDPLGPYDFLSIMHYRNTAFGNGQRVMTPREGYGSFAETMGTSSAPTDLDHQAMAALYRVPMRPLAVRTPLQGSRTRFDRSDFLDAMERLHSFYASRMGLNREGGLSIGGKPDFLGIATWVFDVYMAARSRGFSREQSFQIVVADITATEEWRGKHPGQAPLARPGFTPVVSFDRGEFLDVLNRLDGFYKAPEGLQRPNGLSISGGPDFLGIAAWIFDVYLNERLSGGSPNVAWTRVTDAIRATDEWRSKH